MPSEQPKDGGPAFPHGPIGMSYQGEDGYVSHQHPGSEGMSLRDYFAAKAMAALIQTDFDDMTPVNVSLEAYRYADAMIEKRGDQS